jgi:hypothetical protein
VSANVLERALLFADTLLGAADSLGWAFVSPPPPKRVPQDDWRRSPAREDEGKSKPPPVIGQLLVEGERISFRIEERMREEPRTPTPGELARERREYRYHAARWTLVPTGKLRIVRIDEDSWSKHRKSWYDRGGRRVEDKIPQFLSGFLELARGIKARREKAEREDRERQEAERRRRELAEQREANQKLVEHLETQAVLGTAHESFAPTCAPCAAADHSKRSSAVGGSTSSPGPSATSTRWIRCMKHRGPRSSLPTNVPGGPLNGRRRSSLGFPVTAGRNPGS